MELNELSKGSSLKLNEVVFFLQCPCKRHCRYFSYRVAAPNLHNGDILLSRVICAATEHHDCNFERTSVRPTHYTRLRWGNSGRVRSWQCQDLHFHTTLARSATIHCLFRGNTSDTPMRLSRPIVFHLALKQKRRHERSAILHTGGSHYSTRNKAPIRVHCASKQFRTASLFSSSFCLPLYYHTFVELLGSPRIDSGRPWRRSAQG